MPGPSDTAGGEDRRPAGGVVTDVVVNVATDYPGEALQYDQHPEPNPNSSPTLQQVDRELHDERHAFLTVKFAGDVDGCGPGPGDRRLG